MLKNDHKPLLIRHPFVVLSAVELLKVSAQILIETAQMNPANLKEFRKNL